MYNECSLINKLNISSVYDVNLFWLCDCDLKQNVVLYNTFQNNYLCMRPSTIGKILRLEDQRFISKDSKAVHIFQHLLLSFRRRLVILERMD